MQQTGAAIPVFAGAESGGEALDAAYSAHGVCVIKGLLQSRMVTALRAEADRLKDETDSMPEGVAGFRPALGGSVVFERLDPVSSVSPLIAQLAVEESLLQLGGRLTGGGGALLKDKLIYKLPGDKGYDLHQEFPYFHECDILPDEVTVIGIAIDAMRPDNGELVFFLGYHDTVLPAPAYNARNVDPGAVSANRSAAVALDPGDAVVFHSLTPHKSGPNTTADLRRVLYLTYTNSRHANARAEYYRYRAQLSQAELYGS